MIRPNFLAVARKKDMAGHQAMEERDYFVAAVLFFDACRFWSLSEQYEQIDTKENFKISIENCRYITASTS